MPISVCGAAIDWAATGTMLQGWGTLAGAGVVLAAAVIGSNTFNSWKRQKIAERRMEQAERVLTAAYRGRRALGRVRSSIMHGYELNEAEAQLSNEKDWNLQTNERKRRLKIARGYYNRLENTEQERVDLEHILPISRAFLGETVEAAIEMILQQFWNVKVYVDASIDDTGTDVAFSKEIRAALYGHSPSPDTKDEITIALNLAILSIEEVCLPILRLEDTGKK